MSIRLVKRTGLILPFAVCLVHPRTGEQRLKPTRMRHADFLPSATILAIKREMSSERDVRVKTVNRVVHSLCKNPKAAFVPIVPHVILVRVASRPSTVANFNQDRGIGRISTTSTVLEMQPEAAICTTGSFRQSSALLRTLFHRRNRTGVGTGALRRN